jgi:spore maturation protein CgeB
VEKLAASSRLRERFHGPLWGRDYYQTLRDARIVFNRHIDVAQHYANNLRLYEGTGVGSLMLTDEKSNLADLFLPDHEVAVYRNAAEAVEKAQYYLDHDEEREAIAMAGQRRTLREHTWHHRMKEMVEIVKRYV